MKTYIKKLMHPEGYHGHPNKTPFFEGWYFKLVDRTGQHRYAVIPGISMSQGGIGPHAFIQTLDGTSGKTDYHNFPLNSFSADRYKLNIKIGANIFTAQGMTLALPESDLQMTGHVVFSDLQPWPVTWYAPGIMGWYAWVPFMECYHGVVSMDHQINGALNISGTTVDLTGGRGYIEKDWGKSFPSGWIWMQSNHFSTEGTSFSASIAMIPWIGSSFRGFIIGLLHKGKLYRFATYTRAKTELLKLSTDSVFWIVQDRIHKLEIDARRTISGYLKGPSHSDMARRVPESLQASISVKLTTLSDGKIVFEDSGLNGGLEIAGDLDTLIHTMS